MSGLRELLADVADQAKTYDVTDRAVRAARRRARVHRYAPVAAVVAVALLAVGVWLPLRPSGGGPSLDAGPVPWLPAVVAPPAQPPPALDPDRPVGSGSLLYRVRDRPGTILLASNGREYTVPDGDDRTALSLSPDGRWLLLDTGSRLEAQDLRDGGRRQVSDTDPEGLSWRWSPNSRWLAFAPTGGLPSPTTNLIDLTTWQTIPARTDGSLLAVLDSGEIVVRYPGGSFDSLSAEHPSGATRSLSPRLDGALRPGEQFNPQPVYAQVLSDGDSLLVRAWVELPSGELSAFLPDDLLILGLDGRTMPRRVALPDPVADGPAGAAYDFRESAAVAPEGVVLRHHLLSGAVELELLDPRTGQLAVATHADDRIEDLWPRGYPH